VTLIRESTRRNDAREAKSECLNGPGVDQGLFEHCGGDSRQRSVKVRNPLERSLDEARVEPLAECREPVQPEVLGLPFPLHLFTRRRLLAVPRGGERAPLTVEPVEGRLVEAVPAELVDGQHARRRQERRDLVEPRIEIADVVEGVGGHDRLELLGLLEVLELESAEELAVRRERIDPEHVVSRDGERRRQLALSAADVEHPRGRCGQVPAGELEKRRLRHMPETTVRVSIEEARRIAVRAQLLDGSATSVLDTVRRLGFLQIDVVQPVERPQHLVLFSRLGPGYDRAELDRLLWEERVLFEWDAFIYPIEDLPLVRARIRYFRRSRRTKSQRWAHDFLTENRRFRRYVIRELEQRGPLLSRDFEDLSVGEKRDHRWWGPRMVGLMLLSLHLYGEITVVGRRGGERLWDLAPRWWPETETVSVPAG
jgi:hypothetical protein